MSNSIEKCKWCGKEIGDLKSETQCCSKQCEVEVVTQQNKETKEVRLGKILFGLGHTGCFLVFMMFLEGTFFPFKSEPSFLNTSLSFLYPIVGFKVKLHHFTIVFIFFISMLILNEGKHIIEKWNPSYGKAS